ncbi:MAG: phospho-sugar mutase, partial [Prolixibacteraceae bacterium]|nr:phospho-sugar mutase [Prolixibacteraceae bacterium]
CVKDDNGKFIIVNGNQTALLFIYYIVTRMKEQKLFKGNEFIVKTIVTTEKISDIARENGIAIYDVYTGFKYIAEIIRDLGDSKKYIGGGEESFGFMPASYVRDKDAVSSCALMAEITAWAKDKGKTLYELLKDIYLEYGYSKEKMKYVVRKGRTGAEEIKEMMVNFRENSPKMIGGSLLEKVKDYGCLKEKNMITGEEKPINQKGPSNVLQYFTKGGTKISIRPSGTEPKIKFYFEIRAEMKERADFNLVEKKSEEKIEDIMKEFNL